jgi:hypothetical protein
MGAWKRSGKRTAWVGVLCAVCGAVSMAAAQQSATPEQSAGVTLQAQLPDSPGAALAKLQPPEPRQSASQPASPPVSNQSQGQPGQGQQGQVQQSPVEPSQPQSPPQKPVGTAAAEPVHAGGIAASQPAGVAVAPAKQRRVRTIVIRTAAIIAAGAAVGSVVALTAGTSSKPPGAH